MAAKLAWLGARLDDATGERVSATGGKGEYDGGKEGREMENFMPFWSRLLRLT